MKHEQTGHTMSAQSPYLTEHNHALVNLAKSCMYCVHYLHYIPGGLGYLDNPVCEKKSTMYALECGDYELNYPWLEEQ